MAQSTPPADRQPIDEKHDSSVHASRRQDHEQARGVPRGATEHDPAGTPDAERHSTESLLGRPEFNGAIGKRPDRGANPEAPQGAKPEGR